MPITREQTKYISTNDTVFLPSVAVDSNLGVRGTSVFDNLVTINNGITLSRGNLAINGISPTISSTNSSAASIFTSAVTSIIIGSSTIKTVEYPADGTTDSGATASGYMGMPRGNSGNAITSAYGITAADAGKHLYITTTGQTVTIPANSATPLPIGTTIVFVNGSGVTTTIAITTDTLRQANTSNTGSRTLASNGMATLVKINTTEWIIGGNGLS